MGFSVGVLKVVGPSGTTRAVTETEVGVDTARGYRRKRVVGPVWC